MHDPLPVCLVESVGNLDPESESLLERQRTLEQPVGERLAFQVLHDEVLGLALAPDVVERADVRVGELGDRLGLALEALAGFGRGREVRRQNFDRDGSLQPRVARPVDLAHPARAERRQDLVRTETGPRGKRHPAMPPIPADERSRGTTSAASRRT